MTVPVLLGFLSLFGSDHFSMDLGRFRGWGYRTLLLSVVCAFAMMCVLPPASAGQSSTSKHSSAKQSTKARSAAKARTSTSKASRSKTSKATAAHRRTVSTSTSSGRMHYASSKKSLQRKKKRVRGQQKIDSARAQAIQEALIREHYLTGEATGTWDANSESAMRRYQADNGWQSKTVPDSRALIKLGLGPSTDHLLNPESAMTTIPDPPKATAMPTTSSSPAPVATPAATTPVANSAATTASPDSNPAPSNSTDPQ